MSRLSEELQFGYLIESVSKAATAVATDAVDLSRFSAITFGFAFGAITGNSVLTCYPGSTNAIAAAKSETAIAFKYRLAAADCSNTLADTYGDETAVLYTGLTLTATTFDHKIMLVEFDCDQMTTTNRFLVFSLSNIANPILISAWFVGKPRYPGHTGVTAL